jgi:hypothetical protein
MSLSHLSSAELRELLVFISHDLTDKDIPHRTMLTKLIIENFHKEYKKLLQEIQVTVQVSYQSVLGLRFIHPNCLELIEPRLIHQRCLVAK